jgi:hypothetical protein
MVCIPVAIFRKMKLQSYERRILMIVFSANLLGTAMLLIGIYGIYVSTNLASIYDPSWNETVFVIMSDLEIVAYALGAAAPSR